LAPQVTQQINRFFLTDPQSKSWVTRCAKHGSLVTADADSALRRFDKLQKEQDIWTNLSPGFQFFHRYGEISAFSEQDPKGLSNRANPPIIEAGPF
jgi:hypothetical protein